VSPPLPEGYMPFGHGPKACLGAPLAMAEMRVLLARLARGHAWEVGGDVDAVEGRSLEGEPGSHAPLPVASIPPPRCSPPQLEQPDEGMTTHHDFSPPRVLLRMRRLGQRAAGAVAAGG
jgi:hypothetical protein